MGAYGPPHSPLKLTQKQRERLHRPRPVLFCIIVGLFCSPWLALLGIDTYLRQQQVKTNLQADTFFDQIPVHTSNASAEHIDRLGAQLGLSPNADYANPVIINGSAARDFAAIETAINEFLHSQTSKVSGPLDPLPTELESYIRTYQPTIDEIENALLIRETPRWEMDSARMTQPDYPPPGFFNIRSLQKLLLLSAMQAHQQGQTQKVFSILEASWQLNKTITDRSDLSSQVLVAVISAQRASILRHLNHTPTQWQSRLRSQSQIQPIMKGIVFETWLRYRISQNAWLPRPTAVADANLGEKLSAMVANRFSLQSYYKLISLNNTQTAHRTLEQLSGLNVCTTPQITAEKRLADVKPASWNRERSGASEASAFVMAKRWQIAGMRSLSIELSQHVLQLKSQAQAQGAWPISHAPTASIACPGETWIYTHHPDGSITLSLSKTLLTPGAIPLTYRSPPYPHIAHPSPGKPTLPNHEQ